MAANPNPGDSEKLKSWVHAVQVLLLIAFVVAVYLLGMGMVHHRFFRGGRLDQFGHIRQ